MVSLTASMLVKDIFAFAIQISEFFKEIDAFSNATSETSRSKIALCISSSEEMTILL